MQCLETEKDFLFQTAQSLWEGTTAYWQVMARLCAAAAATNIHPKTPVLQKVRMQRPTSQP